MLRHGNAQRPRHLLYQKLVQFSYDILRNGHNMGSKSGYKRLIITTEMSLPIWHFYSVYGLAKASYHPQFMIKLWVLE